jgi:predicted aspartyl protease
MKSHRYSTALVSILISSILLGQNKSDYQFADNRHSITIPFELSNNHIYLKVKINSSETLDFLFDNGAAASGIMIDSSVAAEMGLKETGKITAAMTGGQNDFSITDSVSLTINKLFVRKQKAAWFQLKAQEKEEGHKIDGILSYSFFKYFVFEIDYLNKHLTIADPKYYYDKKWLTKIHLIDLDRNRVPIVLGILITRKGKKIKTEFTFDTGHDEYIVLGKQFLLSNKLVGDTLKIQPSRVNIGLGGETIHKSGIINGFEIGSLKIQNPDTIFSFDSDGFYSTFDGVLLGGKFFKNYKLILNYPKKYLVLTKS